VDKGTITEEVGTIASIDVTKLVLKQKLTFDHTVGTIVEDGTPAPTPAPTLRRLNGIPADIDLDIEEESHYAMEYIPFRRLSTSADPAHAAAEAFIPTSLTASAPTQENCDDATSLCRVAPFGYNSATACACNGQTDTLNSTTVGGYCSAWGSGWGAESWCYVNSGVLNCGLVETLTLTSSKSRSPGPCSQDAIVSQSNAILEGKWLYKVTLLVGIMLSMFSCCAVCLGFFMSYTLSPRKAQKGGVALLARPAMKGDEYLELDHYAGFQAGQTLVIEPGGFAEEVNHIAKIGSIFLATPLQFDHQPGTRVESIVNHMVPIDIASDGMMFQETLNADWSLEEQFRWAQKMATAKLSDSTPEHVRNELYGYFHQAVDGNCTGKRPSIFYADEQHKFDAWNRLQGMPRNEAMRLYIDSVQTLPH
jgi:acyl-CoA-binding protein